MTRPASQEPLPVIVDREEETFRCPNPDCSSTEIQAVWSTPSWCSVELEDGSAVHDYCSQKSGDPDAENTYECSLCLQPVSLPDDLPITEN